VHEKWDWDKTLSKEDCDEAGRTTLRAVWSQLIAEDEVAKEPTKRSGMSVGRSRKKVFATLRKRMGLPSKRVSTKTTYPPGVVPPVGGTGTSKEKKKEPGNSAGGSSKRKSDADPTVAKRTKHDPTLPECPRCGYRHPSSDACPERKDHPDARVLSEAERQAVLFEGLERKDRPSIRVKTSDGIVQRVPPDGDCLYWALAEGYEGASGQWGRKQALDWLQEICTRDKALGKKLRDGIMAETKETLVQYVARMRPRLLARASKGAGQWGGYVELSVWSTMTKKEVWVFRREGGQYVRGSCFQPLDGSDTEGKKPICVIFSEGHYDIIRFPDDVLRRMM